MVIGNHVHGRDEVTAEHIVAVLKATGKVDGALESCRPCRFQQTLRCSSVIVLPFLLARSHRAGVLVGAHITGLVVTELERSSND